MLILLNRMCWNSRDWGLPSGSVGDGGYHQEYGFGHEEWNFQLDDSIDGYVYGYLYYPPSQESKRKANGHYQIYFWSKDPKTKREYVVGCYEDAMLTESDDKIRLDKAFQKQGIYARRVRELSEVTKLDNKAILKNLMSTVRNGEMRFKCPVEKVKLFSKHILVEEFVPNRNIGRYFTRPTILSAKDISSFSEAKSEQTARIPKRSAANTSLIEDAYFRESPARLKEIIPLHNKLSNQFATWLGKNNFENIRQEENFSDVLFEKRGKTYRAELKICYGASPSRSIREALGQLLEYNYYPNAINTNHWIIILNRLPTPQDIDYISTLKEKLKLPLSLGWKQNKEFAFASKLGIP